MRHLLGFHTLPEQHKIAKKEAFLRKAEDEMHPLHVKIGNRPDSRLKRVSELMIEATKTIEGSRIFIERNCIGTS